MVGQHPTSRPAAAMAALATFILMMSVSLSAWARDIQVRVSADVITTRDVITYTVEATGDVRSIQPPNSDDFEIVGRSTQTSMSFINGHMSRTLVSAYQLAPRRAGVLSTGAAHVLLNTGRSVETESLRIQVSEAGPRPGSTPQLPPPSVGRPPQPQTPTSPPRTSSRSLRSPAAKEFGDYPPLGSPGSDQLITREDLRFDPKQPFILPFVSRPSVVIGEPFLVDYMYYAPITGLGFEAYDLSEPAFKDAWFKDISDTRQAFGPRVSNVQIGGVLFSAQLVRSYLVVPLKEGRFDVAPISVMVSGRSFSRRLEPVLTASPEMQIDVHALPEENRPTPASRSVGRYHFQATISPEEAQVGDTFQLNLEVFGIGVPSQIRLPDVELPANLRAFAPTESSRSVDSTTGWVESRLRRTLSFQATEEGDYVIPSIEFHWYDPWAAQWKTMRSDPLTFRVQGINPHIEIEAENEAAKPLRVVWTQGLPSGDTTPEGIGFAAQLRRLDEPWRGSPLYYVLLAIPVLSAAFIVIAKAVRRRRRDSAASRAFQHAGHASLRELKAAKYRDETSFSYLDRTLRQYLRARAVPNAMGATLAELRQALLLTRSSTHVDALIPLLESLQNARFGGASEEQFHASRHALMDWLAQDQETSQ